MLWHKTSVCLLLIDMHMQHTEEASDSETSRSIFFFSGYFYPCCSLLYYKLEVHTPKREYMLIQQVPVSLQHHTDMLIFVPKISFMPMPTHHTFIPPTLTPLWNQPQSWHPTFRSAKKKQILTTHTVPSTLLVFLLHAWGSAFYIYWTLRVYVYNTRVGKMIISFFQSPIMQHSFCPSLWSFPHLSHP